MNFKKFCILEQGKYLNDPLTKKKGEIFSTEYSDYYKLNWHETHDPDAHICAPGLIFSEGRSYLYEKIPKIYDYYIFLDDDTWLECQDPTENVAEVIRDFLNEYNPVSASFYLDNNPHFKKLKKLPETFSFFKRINLKMLPEVFAARYLPDQLTNIYSKEFADLMFPLPYHGAYGVSHPLWYLAHKICPLKQICFTPIIAKNFRHDNDFWTDNERSYRTGEAVDRIFENFNQAVIQKDFYDWYDQIKKFNLMYSKEVDKAYFKVTLKDLSNFYNINDKFYKNRNPLLS